jgi:hypothetical protein
MKPDPYSRFRNSFMRHITMRRFYSSFGYSKHLLRLTLSSLSGARKNCVKNILLTYIHLVLLSSIQTSYHLPCHLLFVCILCRYLFSYLPGTCVHCTYLHTYLSVSGVHILRNIWFCDSFQSVNCFQNLLGTLLSSFLIWAKSFHWLHCYNILYICCWLVNFAVPWNLPI